MKIVVLCGGISTERDISLKTSAKVANALKSKGHEVVMIDVFFGTDAPVDFSEDQDFRQVAESLRIRKKDITKELIAQYGLMGPHVFETCKKADIVFIGLHGENGEDGKIQAVFDRDITPEDLPGIEVLHTEKTGSVTYIIARGGSEKISEAVGKLSPKMYDEIRLTLEEIFIYEMEVLGYDSSALDK